MQIYATKILIVPLTKFSPSARAKDLASHESKRMMTKNNGVCVHTQPSIDDGMPRVGATAMTTPDLLYRCCEEGRKRWEL
jgi:hypothetical protein